MRLLLLAVLGIDLVVLLVEENRVVVHLRLGVGGGLDAVEIFKKLLFLLLGPALHG